MSHIYIGTAGWSIPGIHAHRCPGEGTHLARYGRQFNCAEINTCFYREHKPETYRKWAALVPEDFRFSVKAPRAITHEGELRAECRGLIGQFLEQTRWLDHKRGPVLLQVPPKLHFDPLQAKKFFEALREMYKGPAAFEPRHPTWFSAPADSLLREFQIARVVADPAVTPEARAAGGWPGLRYIRLHGSPRRYYSAYSEEYLRKLKAGLLEASPAEVWCIFDNTASGAALANALALSQSLK